VAADSSGSVYAAGVQQGNGIYNYGGGASATGAYSGGINAVLVKYNAEGTAQWAGTVTAGNNKSAFNAVATHSSGSVYAAGYQYGNDTYTYGGSASATGTYPIGTNAVLVKYNASGTAQWAKTVTGSGMSEFRAVAVDASGNVYAAGYQYGTGNYDYGSGNITGTSPYSNAVLVKYDADGTVLWAKTITAGNLDSGFNAAAVDSSGNIYAAGAQLGNGAYNYGSGNITGSSYTTYNAVLVKYNASGTVQWAKTVTEGSSLSAFYTVAADASGGVYAAGYQSGTGAYNYGSGNIAGTYIGGNAVLVKYNASTGAAQWAKTVTTGSSSSGFAAVAADASGGVYAAGYQVGSGNFNYGSGNIAGTASTGYSSMGNNAVLVKYNASGTAQWAKTVTTGSNDSYFNAAAADSSGNIYAAGGQAGSGAYNYGSGDTAGTAGNNNAVLVKYSK
jgi:hypothetical protein